MKVLLFPRITIRVLARRTERVERERLALRHDVTYSPRLSDVLVSMMEEQLIGGLRIGLRFVRLEQLLFYVLLLRNFEMTQLMFLLFSGCELDSNGTSSPC